SSRVLDLSTSPTSRRPPSATLFPYPTLFRSGRHPAQPRGLPRLAAQGEAGTTPQAATPGTAGRAPQGRRSRPGTGADAAAGDQRSEEHTSELQSRENLVCRLLLEKKKNERAA